MKVKIGVAFLFLVLITLSLFACGNVSVKDDLNNYVNEWHSKVGDRDTANVDKFNSAINENYVDYPTLSSDIKDDIMPDLKEVIDIAETIEPKTDEVKAVHEKYLNALNMQFTAYELILTAIESQDSEDISQASTKLAEAGKGAQEFAAALSEMAEKYGVELGNADLGN